MAVPTVLIALGTGMIGTVVKAKTADIGVNLLSGGVQAGIDSIISRALSQGSGDLRGFMVDSLNEACRLGIERHTTRPLLKQGYLSLKEHRETIIVSEGSSEFSEIARATVAGSDRNVASFLKSRWSSLGIHIPVEVEERFTVEVGALYVVALCRLATNDKYESAFKALQREALWAIQQGQLEVSKVLSDLAQRVDELPNLNVANEECIRREIRVADAAEQIVQETWALRKELEEASAEVRQLASDLQGTRQALEENQESNERLNRKLGEIQQALAAQPDSDLQKN